MIGKQVITLEEWVAANGDHIYTVKGLKNTVTFHIGQAFTKREVQDLIMNYEVIIKEPKS